jgi:hypothetical protein
MMGAVILCGIPLINLAWKVLPRVLMMKAANPEFDFSFVVNWIFSLLFARVGDDKKVPALIEDDKKFPGFFEIIVV